MDIKQCRDFLLVLRHTEDIHSIMSFYLMINCGKGILIKPYNNCNWLLETNLTFTTLLKIIVLSLLPNIFSTLVHEWNHSKYNIFECKTSISRKDSV